MRFLNKIKTLQILFIFIAISSCKQGKDSTLNSTQSNDSVKIYKLKTGPKLSAEYINSKKKSIEHFYNKNWPHNSINGGFLVAKNGQIIFERYGGYGNYKEKSLITEKTPLHIASVSKVITATAVLKLIDDSKISLNQKVNTILKGFPYPDVTIKTLLTHRSGIRNYSYFTDKKEIWDRHKILSNQEMLNLLIEKKIDLEFRTDSRFSYCNTNYAILALIIEKVTGLKYKDAMKKIIFEPLKMDDTYVFDYEKDKEAAIPSYRGNFSKFNLDYLDAIYGDKNIFSTPRDLLKFDIGRNSPDFFNPELLKKVFIGYSNEHKGKNNYGLGIRMINWETGQNLYFHNGWWHGNTSAYITLPEEYTTIIALSNKFNRMTYKVRNLAALFGDYPLKLEECENEE